MPAQRDDFNNGHNCADWLRTQISKVLVQGKHDVSDDENTTSKPILVQPSIQERLYETALEMTTEIEETLDNFIRNPDSLDPKAYKVHSLLKGKGAKGAHARIIKGLYMGPLEELLELAGGTTDEQLREGYKWLSKKQVRTLIAFYQEVTNACEMLIQEGKVVRKPKLKKPQSKEKIVANLKFMKSNEPLKIVSINPVDILGSKELWVYNTKTRKLGKYIAEDMNTLGIKGTTIIGFNENTSICKTLRKPEEKLKEFKAAGKVQLRKFLDDINATDTKMNGRLNEEVLLLKVV
jgi:uncharacterized protein (DUF433 family)